MSMNTHSIMTVLDTPKVEVRSRPQQPSIELSKDVEDALGEVLMSVDVSTMECLAGVGVHSHPVPLLHCRGTTRRQNNLSTTF